MAGFAQDFDGGLVPCDENPLVEEGFASGGGEAVLDFGRIFLEGFFVDGEAFVNVDEDEPCGGVDGAAGVAVLEFDDGGFDFLCVGCVEGDVAGGEGLQRDGFNAGFFCGFREWFSGFHRGLDFFASVSCCQLEFFVGPLGFEGLGEAFSGLVECHFAGGLGFDEVEDEVGFVADDGVAGALGV